MTVIHRPLDEATYADYSHGSGLCRRYGIKPYRYRGQRRTTLVARVSRRFVDETLWPEFEQLSAVLRKHLDEVTERIIAAAIHEDTSEALETAPPAELEPRSVVDG